MTERTPILDILTHLFLIIGILVTGFPIYVALVAATLTPEQVNGLPMPLLFGDQFLINIQTVWSKADLGLQLFNSAVQAIGITVGKVAISILSAFAIVYFDFRFKMTAFWIIFMSLMLPIEVRIVPTYEVAANALMPFLWLGELLRLDDLASWIAGEPVRFDVRVSLLNSYAGLIFPLIASATATFLFRQFFMTIPNEMTEAAKIDGAGPMRFLLDILLPLSRTNIAALCVILFIYGWNQFLWPLLVTTDPSYSTVVIGIAKLMPQPEAVPEWNLAMTAALIAMAPPVLVVVFLQRLFVKGLVESEK
ncbi:ABC transporter permease subunit [uncultured Nisaea sp.]|jgi:sn-glycerol 3-phosphate transport system permease protein|uniref:ABC transporter permease subunit n=1 Tax=uncultured Nisaea sp. TaxID=538215 RepID=UPI0030EB22F5|tara:strand:+ start:905 stop:1825 length:921 start_codon:yes stop_codon:yes gene_type:complete